MQRCASSRNCSDPLKVSEKSSDRPTIVRSPSVQRNGSSAKRKRSTSSLGQLVSDLIKTAGGASDRDSGKRLRGSEMRLLRRKHQPSVFVPGEALVSEIVHGWVEKEASIENYMQLLIGIQSSNSAVPLVISGHRWPVPTTIPDGLADFRRVAPLLALNMPRECVGALLQLGGAVRDAVMKSLVIFPECQHVLSVRRPDLYWFISSCHTHLTRFSHDRIRPALKAAIHEPWALDVGTVTFRNLVWAATAVEARFRRPGADLVIGGTPAASVSLRDKTLLLYVLFWGTPSYFTRGVPACAPLVISALGAAMGVSSTI